MKSIEENGTSELTNLPKGHRAIGLKWVFKLRKDATGEVIKHKARLVAKATCSALASTSTKSLLPSRASTLTLCAC